jgi:adenylate cyclase
MPLEIERKFLVINDSWRNRAPGARFCQGYLTNTGVTVRVRRAGSRAYLIVKGPQRGICRSEFEYPISVDEAEEMLRSLCKKPLLEKTRYEVMHERHIWFVDVFAGNNAGLVLAEIELDHLDQPFARPDWIGAKSPTIPLTETRCSPTSPRAGIAGGARPDASRCRTVSQTRGSARCGKKRRYMP